MATKGAREHITLECTECHNRNYMTDNAQPAKKPQNIKKQNRL